MNAQSRTWLIRLTAVVALTAIAAAVWQKLSLDDPESGLASGNGRIEAVEIDIATRSAGRVKAILVREGEFVSAGQAVAHMDTENLEAQLRQAQAQLRQAQSAVITARSQVTLREAEKAAAQALLAQREAEHAVAKTHLSRTARLAKDGAISQQQVDDDRARVQGAAAAVSAVQAQIAAADAAIATARAQVIGAEEAVAAVQASIERIGTDIADSELRAPRDGRIQYLVAQPGEVLGGGGRVMNLLDLKDVYMTFFLPTSAVGRIALGSEVRLVLDAAPQFVIPANVSFIADVAQFTPKTVETSVEREKLMFRVRARIPPELLEKHILQVKTGLPGMAHVRLDQTQPWPVHLQVRLPE
ncbi:MAG: HlyD family efflux transporter periplasmic adaptor subunit [Chromatiales bacterium]|nr:HlyD family efflux transporter periplasmic adaptor subunit [Chromatiales bacterium]